MTIFLSGTLAYDALFKDATVDDNGVYWLASAGTFVSESDGESLVRFGLHQVITYYDQGTQVWVGPCWDVYVYADGKASSGPFSYEQGGARAVVSIKPDIQVEKVVADAN